MPERRLSPQLGFSLAAFPSAVVYAAGVTSDIRALEYLFKPLTTLLIIGVALAGVRAASSAYGRLVVCGLAFCLVGDVFLMLPGDWFQAGLFAFLLGHVCFAFAFALGGLRFTWWLFGLVALVAGLAFAGLSPGLGPLFYPVMVYSTAIALMLWLAWERWHVSGEAGTLLAAVGATSFIVSDSALAANRFLTPYPGADLVVLSTYFTAIWLIAMSVVSRARCLPRG